MERPRGYCKRCRKWRTPADTALGLEDSAGYSPAVQALAALAASKLPVAEASVVLEHLAGVQLPPAPSTAKPNARANAPNASAPSSISKPPRRKSNSNSPSNPTR